MKQVFVTTGTQLPFNRLVSIVNKWASKNKDVKVLAQVCSSSVLYDSIETFDIASPSDYEEIVSGSDLIVGHAGMGTIITAHKFGVPLILMARKFKLNEHRNDHQLDTVSQFKDFPGIYVVEDEKSFNDTIENFPNLTSCSEKVGWRRGKLLKYVRDFIELSKG